MKKCKTKKQITNFYYIMIKDTHTHIQHIKITRTSAIWNAKQFSEQKKKIVIIAVIVVVVVY